MSYYKDFNPIRNGDFSKPGPDDDKMHPFLHWISDFYFDENNLVKYVATSTTDYELKDTVCCRFFIDETRARPSEALLPGLVQDIEIYRATSESVLTIQFLAKHINGTLGYSDYVAVALKGAEGSEYFQKEEIKITDSSYSWVKCHCEFKLDGNGPYTLTITGAKTSASSSPYYEPQEFLISNVKANVTNHIAPYINIVDHGEFDALGDLDFWDKSYTWADPTYEISINNGELKLSGAEFDDVGVIQELSIPDFIDLNQYCCADIVVDADVYGESTLAASLYGHITGVRYDEVLNTGYANSGRKSVKVLASKSIDYPNYSLTSYDKLSLEVYARKYIFNQTSGYGVSIRSIKVNLFDPNTVSLEGTGDFNSPYTDEDGRILYHTDKNEFKFYNGSAPSKRSFILIDGKYYLADSSGMCKEGIYAFDDKLYYVFPNGRVACNEKFIYEDKVYQADGKGQYTYLCEKLSYINIKHKGNIINSKLVGITKGAIRLELEFPEQYEDVTLTATTKNGDRVIKSINIAPGLKNNVVNLITENGQDAITFSYVNIDGSEIKASFFIDVVDYGNEYDQELSLDILSDVHYVALDSSLGISYIIRPNLAVEVDVDWSSSDEDIAIVDVFGNVKPMGIGTCTITARSQEANVSDTCTLHVVRKTDAPASISLSQYEANLGISDSVFVKATVLNESGTTVNTNQEVKWESGKTSIATVSNGYIVGVGEGTTNIYCYSYDDKTIQGIVKVEVSGEVTAIKEIELNMYETMLDYNNRYNAYEYLEWTPIPLNTNQTEVILVSSDPGTVEVAANGKLTIGGKPQLNVPIVIKCTSVSNPEIYRECIVTVVDRNYLPTITMKEKSVRAYIGKTISIEYYISKGYAIQDAVIKATASGAYSDNIASILGNTIQVIPMETGKFTLTISYTSNYGTVSKTCEIIIYKDDEEPQYAKYLDLLYAFQNGSYVLRYFAVDTEDDLSLKHYIDIDNEDYFNLIEPELLLYKGDEYHYYFGDGLKPGAHTIKLKVVDTRGFENIDEVSLIISDKNNRKEVLKNSQDHYDEIKEDLIDCLNDIIEDEKMSIDNKREFTTRYKMFNIAYENLLNMLDHCVKHINSQIETSQSEMATLADSLDTGVAVATYSEGDYTNSNFETVSDYDYYQSECIKALAKKVLALEAIVQELQSKL